MINASDQILELVIQEHSPDDWRRMIDTCLEGPSDIVVLKEFIQIPTEFPHQSL
jgi:hypothetical protein